MTILKFKLKNVLFSIAAWIFLLAVINFLCGFIVKNTYISVDAVNSKTAESSCGYFKPNQEKIILFPGLGPYKVTINSLGLRSVGLNNEFPLSLEELRTKYKILCLGDSVTFGLFVDDEDSYPYQLQQVLLKENSNAAVLNAGVGGGTISDYLYYLKLKGLRFKPDLVLINFCPNDLGELNRKVPLYEKIKNENIFSLAKTIKLAKLLRVFRKFEVNYKYHRYLRKVQDQRAKKILREETKDLEDVLYVRKIGAGKVVFDPYNEELNESWKLYFESLAEVIDLLKREKIQFIYVIYPDIANLYDKTNGRYQDILRSFLDKNKVEYIDLLPVFKEKREQFLKLYNNPPRDYHLSGYGNQILAQEIYNRIGITLR
jgi:lysophospholipase L1-like esterase